MKKHTKTIEISVPDGVSDETVREFLTETLEKYPAKQERREPQEGDVYDIDGDGKPALIVVNVGGNLKVIRTPWGWDAASGKPSHCTLAYASTEELRRGKGEFDTTYTYLGNFYDVFKKEEWS